MCKLNVYIWVCTLNVYIWVCKLNVYIWVCTLNVYVWVCTLNVYICPFENLFWCKYGEFLDHLLPCLTYRVMTRRSYYACLWTAFTIDYYSTLFTKPAEILLLIGWKVICYFSGYTFVAEKYIMRALCLLPLKLHY